MTAMDAAPHERDAFRHVDRILDRAAEWIEAAEHIVLCTEGGFGHQLHGPDLVRYAHRDRPSLFILVEWEGRHNPCVPLIWGNPRVLHIPMLPPTPQQEPLTQSPSIWSERLGHHIRARLEDRFGRTARAYQDFLDDIGRLRPIADRTPSRDQNTASWIFSYFQLLREQPLPRRRLPEQLRTVMADALAALCGTAGAKICTLYLRQKGGPPDSVMRSGAQAQEYGPAVGCIRQAGYLVFVMGDSQFIADGVFPVRRLAQRLCEEGWSGALKDAAIQADPVNAAGSWANLQSRDVLFVGKLLELFLMTEADIFIGEAGGGLQLAPYEGIPTLALNFFPYGAALPNTAHLYKVVLDGDGVPVPYQRLFTRDRWSYEISGTTVRCNTAAEMLNAVAIFLRSLHSHPLGIGASQLMGLPEDAWMAHCNGVISPAFFQIYTQGKA